MEGKWKGEEEERVGSPALLHLACSYNTRWIVYLSIPSFLHFSLVFLFLLLHFISLSLSLSISLWPFCFMLSGANGRQIDSGKKKNNVSSPALLHFGLTIQSGTIVLEWETPCLWAEKRNGVKGDDCNTFSIFVLPLLVYSALFLHCSLSFSLSLSPSLHLDFLVKQYKRKAHGKRKKQNESAPLLSCTFMTYK